MAMDVPQGPGSALKFMTDEPSTCFTPNFESAKVTQDSRADEEFERRQFRSQSTIDFENSMVGVEEHKWNLPQLTQTDSEQSNYQSIQSKYLVKTRDSNNTGEQIISQTETRQSFAQPNFDPFAQEDENSMYPWLKETR